MSDQQSEAFDAVDALLAAVESGQILPPLAERTRLREAAGLTRAAVAQALGVRVASLQAWEEGRSEPTEPRREAYRRLLEGLAVKFPSPTPAAPSMPVAPATAPTPAAASVPAARSAPVKVTRTVPATAGDARFAHGPLLVLDGDGSAYGVDGLVLDCPAKTIPELVEWTLAEARIGSPKLHPPGKDGDPLVVLTSAATERFGLPKQLADRAGLRLPEDHPVVKQLVKANWQLTKRGFGSWSRIYRPALGGQRRCVQLAVLPWDALDTRSWGDDAAVLPAPQIAHMLGAYATRVITPVGAGAVCGTELMTVLRPPTRAVRDTDGVWRSAAMPGSLAIAVDPAPPEPPGEHPLAQGRPEGPTGAIDEESLVWARSAELLTDAECALPFAVGIDVNTAYLAASSRLRVGLGEAVHVTAPVFDKKLAGSWLVDLTGIALDPRLPSPFTPTGQAPTGPAWYATPTVAYAQELAKMLGRGVELRPLEAWLRPDGEQLRDLVRAYGVRVPAASWEAGGELAALERLGLTGVLEEDDNRREKMLKFLATVPRFAAGPYLDPWHTRLRDAYMATMADLGVTADLSPEQFLTAMEHHKEVDPVQAAVLSAIKATVKGGVGKLRERPQGRRYNPGDPWPALRRTTWRPDIRAAVISASRVNLHRKMMALALKADRYPLAVNVDCVVYPSAGPSALDALPYRDGRPLPGGFRLGVSPGMVKPEGSREFLWAAQLMDAGGNPARVIKGSDAFLGGE